MRGILHSHDLARYFHLDDEDHALIAKKRGEHNRLGFAVQLSTVRYLGTFLDDPMVVPAVVLHTVAKQLRIEVGNSTLAYSSSEQRWLHATEIRTAYGYVEITEPRAAFRLTRYTRCAGPGLTGQAYFLNEQPCGWYCTKYCSLAVVPSNATLLASAVG
jgi:hypothetical protein